ncbi:MAG: hypothetical protein ACTSQG_04140 [Promethearchaeota archaeon]
MIIPTWDCFTAENTGWYFDLLAIWLITVGLFGASLYAGHAIAQKHYTGKFDHIKNVMYGVLIIGIILFYGMFEDFSVFIYRGIHYFNPKDAWWHYDWFYNLFPIYYFQAIPGIILIIIAFSWDVKNNKNLKRNKINS